MLTWSVADKLIEGEDFYWEGPYMVLAGKFLRQRGYCCESGCRHCPYGFRRDARAERPSETGESDEDGGPLEDGKER